MIRVIFDGPPGPEAGRFVEVEDERWRSFNAGNWKPCVDHPEWWELQIRPSDYCDCDYCRDKQEWPPAAPEPDRPLAALAEDRP